MRALVCLSSLMLIIGVIAQVPCNIHGCTYEEATDGGSNPTITFPGLDYSPKCMRVASGTVVTFEGSFQSHPLVSGYFSKYWANLFGGRILTNFSDKIRPRLRSTQLRAPFPLKLIREWNLRSLWPRKALIRIIAITITTPECTAWSTSLQRHQKLQQVTTQKKIIILIFGNVIAIYCRSR